mmetsp:Transcript_16083/g.32186  ORF Transcript_16083/g.32186 Transcript_16083/m.32186 type:complete len:282 (-) Transcript_16083:313-1158(-)|eukprot:CAMPEP_0181313766 /NCGR_PEP_ID=MMETSP1101-20121128/14431_1 /TAXON_ID=46948 /ORGANISM="Rhodomonas abbreviata, Strain Caron Lab Isolate" /LENGTH=281 /DNA_ID=CAMNT_0023420757 /DNA_START=42 /DNA_END=887 /DNA_ORIENTATION=-
MSNPASDPAPETTGRLDGFQFNLGHQETDRIVDELEQICKQVRQSAGDAWMSADSAVKMLCTNLGYEDQGEFEDGLKTSFDEFIKALPHIESKIQDDGSAADGKLVFRFKKMPPPADRKMFVKKLRITSRQDLWRVCHKAPSAVVEIPELEFEIGADAKRKIDSIYNHIASSVYNLTMHVSQHGANISTDHKQKIGETVQSLNALLDVDEPWTFMVHDRTGISEIRPDNDVETIYGGPAEEDPLETEERQYQSLLDAIDEDADDVPAGEPNRPGATVLDVD